MNAECERPSTGSQRLLSPSTAATIRSRNSLSTSVRRLRGLADTAYGSNVGITASRRSIRTSDLSGAERANFLSAVPGVSVDWDRMMARWW